MVRERVKTDEKKWSERKVWRRKEKRVCGGENRSTWLSLVPSRVLNELANH